jgi:hypothetical protein
MMGVMSPGELVGASACAVGETDTEDLREAEIASKDIGI